MKMFYRFLASFLFAAIVAENTHAAGGFNILFLGDSLTAGFGIEQDGAYPALIQKMAESNGYPVTVTNAGMSGDTSAGALRRLPWLLKQKRDLVLVALGANDGLRGLPVKELRENLRKAVDAIREANPEARIILAGMKLPRNLGVEYVREFEAVYGEVAKEKGVSLLPFLLEGVASDPELNLEDRMHPNVKGHEIIAATVWKSLEPMLKELR
jgi:acyl-CoA thioesterase I